MYRIFYLWKFYYIVVAHNLGLRLINFLGLSFKALLINFIETLRRVRLSKPVLNVFKLEI